MLAICGSPPYRRCFVGDPPGAAEAPAAAARSKRAAPEAAGACETDVAAARDVPAEPHEPPAQPVDAAHAQRMLTLFHDDPPAWLAESKLRWAAQHRSQRSEAPAKKRKPPGANPSGGASGAGPAPGRESGKAQPRRAVLRELLAAGIVLPGEGNAFLKYRDKTFVASITVDGQLRGADGTLYSSPSAWSLRCKRELQPDLKTDDGNRSIRYGTAAGPTLEALKQQLPAAGGAATDEQVELRKRIAALERIVAGDAPPAPVPTDEAMPDAAAP